MLNNNATCLITGGAGFIGCAISSGLSGLFSKLIAVDCLHPQIHSTRARPEALDRNVELIIGDVTDPKMWDRLLSLHRPDVVVHLAAETGTGQSLTEATRHANTNVVGTAEMLDAFTRHKITPKKFVLSSSRAVYGEGAWCGGKDIFYPGQRSRDQLASEQWDFHGEPLAMNSQTIRTAPVSVYGATKLAQEHILSSWCNAIGSEIVILRLQNVFGPGQSLINSYTGIVSLFCQQAKDGKSIPLYEDGLMLRDFVLIDDVATAIIAAVKKEGISGQIFDVGAGLPTTIRNLADEISSIYGAPAPHVCGKYRFGDVRHAYGDISHAVDGLSWTPRFRLSDGLKALVSWIEAKK